MELNSKVAYEKLDDLKEYLKGLGSLAIGFSGGVDSTFLAKVGKEVLGDKLLAVTCVSGTFSKREKSEAEEFCEKEGIKQVMCYTDELKIPGFSENPPNRCYICKKEIFTNIMRLAKENGIEYTAEGSNMSDLGDYRPGLMAIEELGVKSPLREAKLYKEEIRFLSKEMGLSTWNKPAFACLASRFAYGETITKEKLSMVEKAEEFLRNEGFVQFRVRVHGNLARIEVLADEMPRFLENNLRNKIYSEIKNLGFDYVSLDLLGYRTGSMNEVILK